jgi:hypothetical protein
MKEAPVAFNPFTWLVCWRTRAFRILAGGPAGWYDFELRYRNPSATIDIQLSKPGNSTFAYIENFYMTTPTPPKSYYWAPKIALSSTWQVRSGQARCKIVEWRHSSRPSVSLP